MNQNLQMLVCASEYNILHKKSKNTQTEPSTNWNEQNNSGFPLTIWICATVLSLLRYMAWCKVQSAAFNDLINEYSLVCSGCIDLTRIG